MNKFVKIMRYENSQTFPAKKIHKQILNIHYQSMLELHI